MILRVYDFDGTLFRSPGKPSSWTDSWWANPISLGPPHVPFVPGAEWWVEPVVTRVKSDDRERGIYKVLLTGRLDRFYHDRVHQLLLQKGLRFNEVKLAPGGSTERFKLREIERLIWTLRPDRVEIWDDRPEHLDAFHKYLVGHKVPHRLHLVPK